MHVSQEVLFYSECCQSCSSRVLSAVSAQLWDQCWVPGILLSCSLSRLLPLLLSHLISLSRPLPLVEEACHGAVSLWDIQMIFFFFFLREPDAPVSYLLLFQSIPVRVLDKSEINIILQYLTSSLGVVLFLQIVFPLRSDSLKTFMQLNGPVCSKGNCSLIALKQISRIIRVTNWSDILNFG